MSNLNVNFKAPITVIDALREVVLGTYVECQAKSEREVWDKLGELERQTVNRLAHRCELLARFFEVELPPHKG